MNIERREESAEFIYKDGQRSAMFDEKGELFVIRKAGKNDREELFTQKSS